MAIGVRLPLLFRSTALGCGCGASEVCVCQRWRLRPPVGEHQHIRGRHNRMLWPWRTNPVATSPCNAITGWKQQDRLLKGSPRRRGEGLGEWVLKKQSR